MTPGPDDVAELLDALRAEGARAELLEGHLGVDELGTQAVGAHDRPEHGALAPFAVEDLHHLVVFRPVGRAGETKVLASSSCASQPKGRPRTHAEVGVDPHLRQQSPRAVVEPGAAPDLRAEEDRVVVVHR